MEGPKGGCANCVEFLDSTGILCVDSLNNNQYRCQGCYLLACQCNFSRCSFAMPGTIGIRLNHEHFSDFCHKCWERIRRKKPHVNGYPLRGQGIEAYLDRPLWKDLGYA